jgi:diguanylate cyclase (GGDEF)-like protein
VLTALAGLSRQQRIGPFRLDAGRIAPALFFALLLLTGPLPAAGAIAVTYASAAWRGARRNNPLAEMLVQLGATLLAASVFHLRGVDSGAIHADWGTLLLGGLTYWAVWESLSAPLPWLAGRSQGPLSVGTSEEMMRGLLLVLAGITLASLWVVGALQFSCGLISIVFLSRVVTSSHFGREALLEPKTGLFNSRYFQEITESELDRCRRLERPASVIMADLDHLRDVNNRYGHQAGDAVIRRVAEQLRAGIRTFDVPARFGGEEFAILLPETGKRRARVIAERLRQMVADQEFRAARLGARASAAAFTITLSLGVATFPDDAVTAESLIARADQAAYAAKHAGRNQVKLYDSGAVLVLEASS